MRTIFFFYRPRSLRLLAGALVRQDKRRLEREKTYYWGQAEELRISAGAGGRADPARDADHQQLVEQTRELIEENRELRQRAQVIFSLFRRGRGGRTFSSFESFLWRHEGR